MIDFGQQRRRLYGAIKSELDPVFIPLGYQWHRGNFWAQDLGWAQRSCSLGVGKISSGLYLELIGGAGLFLREYHPLFQPDYLDYGSVDVPPASLGGPVHWIDEQLSFDAGRFTTWEQFEALLPRYRRAFEEQVIPELERYPSEDALLEVLLDGQWSKKVRLSATQDRRGALVALMLAKRRGVTSALGWAQAEVARIKAQEPDRERPGRWREIKQAIDHLSSRSS